MPGENASARAGGQSGLSPSFRPTLKSLLIIFNGPPKKNRRSGSEGAGPPLDQPGPHKQRRVTASRLSEVETGVTAC